MHLLAVKNATIPDRVSEEQMLAVNLMLMEVIESSGPSLGGGGVTTPEIIHCSSNQI